MQLQAQINVMRIDVFKDYDPAKRVTASERILRARAAVGRQQA